MYLPMKNCLAFIYVLSYIKMYPQTSLSTWISTNC